MKFNFWQVLGLAVLVLCIVLYARRHANAPTTPPANSNSATTK